MIVPPGTSCPPKALKPSRCAFESRPFREVPCPFLCAIESVSSSQWPVATEFQSPNHYQSQPYFFFFLAAFFGAAFLACACAACFFTAFFPGRFEVFTSS